MKITRDWLLEHAKTINGVNTEIFLNAQNAPESVNSTLSRSRIQDVELGRSKKLFAVIVNERAYLAYPY